MKRIQNNRKKELSPIANIVTVLFVSYILASFFMPWGVSFPRKNPESGVWHCEELKTSIDFNLYRKSLYIVKVYNDDGTFEMHGCHTDYGAGISFFTYVDDEYTSYFHGRFLYLKKMGYFIIVENHTDNVYVFTEQNPSVND